jgi:LAO/AO transport system kinase
MSGEGARLIESAVRGDTRSIGRLITMVEEGEDGALFKFIAKKAGKAHIMGFTGAPGVGKSSLISVVASMLSKRGERVAIIAIDPSSPITGGAFLGDRIRMVDISLDENVFIRSMGSRGALGGLARSAGEVALLMDALGFDHVLIETVGAGQSDIEVMKWVHSVVVMISPGGGDDIQFAKAGIMEIGDLFVINKSDLSGVELTYKYLKMELEEQGSDVPVIKTSVTKGNEGVDELVEALYQRSKKLKKAGELEILKYMILSNKTRQEILRRIEGRIEDWLVEKGKEFLSSGLSPEECADRWERENKG